MTATRCGKCAGFVKIDPGVAKAFVSVSYEPRMCKRTAGAASCSPPRSKAATAPRREVSKRESLMAPTPELSEDFRLGAKLVGGVSVLAKRLGIGRHTAEQIVHGSPTSKAVMFLAAASFDAWAKHTELQGIRKGHADKFATELNFSAQSRAKILAAIEEDFRGHAAVPGNGAHALQGSERKKFEELVGIPQPLEHSRPTKRIIGSHAKRQGAQ